MKKNKNCCQDNVVTAEQMQAIDRCAIEEYGIPGMLLMENAGRGISELINFKNGQSRVLILAGKGNNGGDGLVIARHLFNRKFKVRVLLFAKPAKLKNDPALNFKIIQKMGIPCEVADENWKPANLHDLLKRFDWVVDALFGVGLNAQLREPFMSIIKILNASKKKVIAVDIPSGLNADTGQAMGIAVKANITATLGLPKKGLFSGEGPHYAGKVFVLDIGIPKQLLKSISGRKC